MNKAYAFFCRACQTVFRAALPILPYCEPVQRMGSLLHILRRHAARESNPLYPVPVLMDERQLAQMYVQLMPVKKEENA